MQDQFALSLLKEAGYFLDIGCRGDAGNNTKALEERGWTGLLFDIRQRWVDVSRDSRTSPVFKVDASSKEFLEILNKHSKNKLIDYISLDVDTGSIGTLNNIFKGGYEFKTITFEHDLYSSATPDILKPASMDMFTKNGYFLLFENVLTRGGKPFEDWWIHPDYFGDGIKALAGKDLSYQECVKRVST